MFMSFYKFYATEVQPHLHLQISSRGYTYENISSSNISAYDFIDSGVYNRKLQDIKTYYDARKIFVDVMNEYLVKEGFEKRFSEKSLLSKINELDDNSNVLEVIDVLREDLLKDSSIDSLDKYVKRSEYDNMYETYKMYQEVQDVLDNNKKNLDIVDRVKDVSSKGDEHLLYLMDKRNRLFNKVLNFSEEMYKVNGNNNYRTYILARESNKGVYVEDYQDINKIIVKEDSNHNIKDYYKVGHMGDMIKKLNRNITNVMLETRGVRYLDETNINKSLLLSNIDNMVALSSNMDLLGGKVKSDYVIGDSNKDILSIKKDNYNIEKRYLNMLISMIECDSLIQIGLSKRNEDNLLKKVYEGKNISVVLTDDKKTLSDYIDNKITILDEFKYSAAIGVLKDLEKQLKEFKVEKEEDNVKYKELYDYFMKLKNILSSNEIKEKLVNLKKEYYEYTNKLNDLKQDDIMRTRIQNIVDMYRLGYIKMQEEDNKVSQKVQEYIASGKISKLNNKVKVQDLV